MTEILPIDLEAEVLDEDASRDIAKAVSARHSIARKYVLRLRRKHPDATPPEAIRMLERHYATSITTAGAVIAAGVVAADVGIAMIPVAGAVAMGAKSASQQAAKKTVKEAAKVAVKGMALDAAKSGAQGAAGRLTAGDQQLQFEITAIFALAVADIHGMELDRDQAQALVYGLSNERVSQQQIAAMATDVANVSPEDVVGNGLAPMHPDRSHWATTLADTLPGEAAQSLVRTIQTGHLETVRETLGENHQAVIEYGVAAVKGGVARFAFGRDVIAAARDAFPEAPDVFPAYLALQLNESDSAETESNRALAALEDAAKVTGGWVTGAASTVGDGIATSAAAFGTGAATAAGTLTRPFRSVDIDGDGIPDAPKVLTMVKGAGGAVGGATGAASERFTGLFKRGKRDATTVTADGELAGP